MLTCLQIARDTKTLPDNIKKSGLPEVTAQKTWMPWACARADVLRPAMTMWEIRFHLPQHRHGRT